MVDAPKLVNFSKSDLEIHSNARRFSTERDKKRGMKRQPHPSCLVIRLGLEPKTPTLKVLSLKAFKSLAYGSTFKCNLLI